MADLTVAFIGLGNMGLPMAKRLLAAGRRVIGVDVVERARTAFAAAGGEVAATAADAAGAANVVVLMLPDASVVESVIDEIEGRLTSGTLVVDMSSSEPLRTRALASRLATHAVPLVDAPVSGGVPGAVAGKLTIMAGGEPDQIAAIRPVLAPLGRLVVAGPVGAGHAAKAINNLLSATHLWATGEGVEIGRRFGIEPAVLIEIVNGSSGRSGSSQNKWPNYVLPGRFDSGFPAGLMLKDVRIALGLAEGVGADALLGRRVAELWTRAVDDLGPAADHTEVGRWITDHGQSDHAPKE